MRKSKEDIRTLVKGPGMASVTVVLTVIAFIFLLYIVIVVIRVLVGLG